LQPPDHYRTQIIEHLSRIGPQSWNRLAAQDADATPFLSFEFLQALHESGCASTPSGWTPTFLTLSDEQGLAAAAPLYRKAHSFGEYVFDWAWARAHEARNLPYYPKWLVAVPFTPAPGSRLLARDEPARAALAAALVELARKSALSSLHVLLAPPVQIETLALAGLLVQPGVQFRWSNAGYGCFDDFLSALAQEKRKKIRAERRKVAQAGVELQRRVGTQITEHDWRFFHRCYLSTYEQHGSVPYLSLDFFLRLARSMPERLLMVLAQRDGRPIACAFAVFCPVARGGTIYGRHWGAAEFVSCLHFECCYYQMIEFAIERGLATFEGGTQGTHKIARGLDPVPTWSAHWIADPTLRRAIANALDRQRSQVAMAIDELQEHSALRAARSDSIADADGRGDRDLP
jgi:predicted N-acyltransferase